MCRSRAAQHLLDHQRSSADGTSARYAHGNAGFASFDGGWAGVQPLRLLQSDAARYAGVVSNGTRLFVAERTSGCIVSVSAVPSVALDEGPTPLKCGFAADSLTVMDRDNATGLLL